MSKNRSKLGRLVDERGLKLKDFAELIYDKTGYVINITNLSNYCTGIKEIKSVKILKNFAKALDVSITDII